MMNVGYFNIINIMNDQLIFFVNSDSFNSRFNLMALFTMSGAQDEKYFIAFLIFTLPYKQR